MKKILAVSSAVIGLACSGFSQVGRTGDWWTYGGDAERSGWEKNDQRFTKADVPNFQLLWKMKLNNRLKGGRGLLPPVVLGNLIGYRGFKELAFVAGSSDSLWVIDADLARMYWEKHFESGKEHGGKAGECVAGLTAMPVLPPPVMFRLSAAARERLMEQARKPSGAGPAGGGTNPDGTPRPAGVNPSANAARSSSAQDSAVSAFLRRFAPKPIYVVGSNGKLYRFNEQDGSEFGTATSFLPPGANAQSLNVADNFLYTSTTGECGGAPNAVWTLDLDDPAAKPVSFATGADLAGMGGPVVSNEGSIYVQTAAGPFNASANQYGNAVLALTPKTLKLRDYLELGGTSGKTRNGAHGGASPVAFMYKGREMVAAAGPDNRLYLIDGKAPGGGDHKTPLSRSEPLSAQQSGGLGVVGSLSSWEEPDGTRYILAPVWGPVASLGEAGANGDVSSGAIVAFKVERKNGSPVLTPAWVSHDLRSPAPPVISQGVVFALSNGEYSLKGKELRAKSSSHATLYAFDGKTGKEVYTTGDQVTAPGSLTGLTVANSRVYFTTTDNTVWAFGKYLETDVGADYKSTGNPKQ